MTCSDKLRHTSERSINEEIIAVCSTPLSAVSHLSFSLATAGKITEALTATQYIEDESSRADALRDVAEALAQSGKVRDALSVAQSIKDASPRAKALCDIALALPD